MFNGHFESFPRVSNVRFALWSPLQQALLFQKLKFRSRKIPIKKVLIEILETVGNMVELGLSKVKKEEGRTHLKMLWFEIGFWFVRTLSCLTRFNFVFFLYDDAPDDATLAPGATRFTYLFLPTLVPAGDGIAR